MDVITELGPSAVAAMCGVRPPSVIEWRKRGIPPDRCVRIERGTMGRYVCEQLRDDIRWVRVPDPEWPWHPQGRPLQDHSAAVAEREAA